MNRNHYFVDIMKKIKKELIFASIIGVLISLGVGFLSSMVTKNAIPTWYANLEKHFFHPLIGFLHLFGHFFIL